MCSDMPQTDNVLFLKGVFKCCTGHLKQKHSISEATLNTNLGMMCINVLAGFAGLKVKNSMKTYSSASPEAQMKQYAVVWNKKSRKWLSLPFCEKKSMNFGW